MAESLQQVLDEAPPEVAMWLESSPPIAEVDPDERYTVVRPEPERLCALFRAIGIARLLTVGDTDGFYDDLMRSARARIYFLGRASEEGYVGPDLASSRWNGLFDALAANDLDAAREIGRSSPAEWMKEDEYEDDFCYARFLHLWIDAGDSDEIAAVLERFEESLEGGGSARLDVCRALLGGEPSSFDAAFAALVDEREAEIADAVERHELVTDSVLTDRAGFVEGLALLRLAAAAGFSVRDEYPLCPALARLERNAGFPDDGYPRL